MLKVIKEKNILDDHIVVQEAWITDGKHEEFSRLYVKRVDAAVVLIINTDSNKVVLTKQFRCAVASKTQEEILEIVAGKVDGDEEACKTVKKSA